MGLSFLGLMGFVRAGAGDLLWDLCLSSLAGLHQCSLPPADAAPSSLPSVFSSLLIPVCFPLHCSRSHKRRHFGRSRKTPSHGKVCAVLGGNLSQQHPAEQGSKDRAPLMSHGPRWSIPVPTAAPGQALPWYQEALPFSCWHLGWESWAEAPWAYPVLETL